MVEKEDYEWFREEAEKHFEYVKKLLKLHGESDLVIEKIHFHYVEAMIHGYKHALEDMKEEVKE